MKRSFWLALCLITFNACGPKEKVTRVAVALPLTGDIAALGQGLERASRLALEEANAQNRFPGFKVEMVSFDDHSDPREAVNREPCISTFSRCKTRVDIASGRR